MMICAKCRFENELGAIYCTSCGSRLIKNGRDVSSTLLLVWVIFTIILWYSSYGVDYVFRIVESESWEMRVMVYRGINVLAALNNLLPALTVKRKNLRIIAMMLVLIHLIAVVVEFVIHIMKM